MVDTERCLQYLGRLRVVPGLSHRSQLEESDSLTAPVAEVAEDA
jgi:hypothetical protein